MDAMSKRWKCKVIRKLEWDLEVEADTLEEAKAKADAIENYQYPHDDYAYETTATEIK